MHVLSGVDLGPEFHAMVDAIGALLSPSSDWGTKVVLDALPDSSARLDLVRLAAITALERTGGRFSVCLPIGTDWWTQSGSEWLVCRTEAAPVLTFRRGERQPAERTITIFETEDAVRVTVGGTPIEVLPPSEQDCRRSLGVRGPAVRFPMFPDESAALLARGDGPDELVLWRVARPAVRLRLPGPVMAATHGLYENTLAALVEVDGELVMHLDGPSDPPMRDLRVPIDFSVADEAERDLSPLYIDTEDCEYGVCFRRGGTWWRLRLNDGAITLTPSPAALHQTGAWPFRTRFADSGLFGPFYSHADRREAGWTAWGERMEDTVIPVPPGEGVVGLTKIAHTPALLTRQGDIVRARTQDTARTVVEFSGPLITHPELPWVAVQRSPHLVEIIDIATGAVLHRLDTA